MYQVIIVYDEKLEKSYYNSYVESNVASLGNLTVEDLPPYQDINKARACYYDEKGNVWVFDKAKYLFILDGIEKQKKEAEMSQIVMSNEELTNAVIELSELIGGLL